MRVAFVFPIGSPLLNPNFRKPVKYPTYINFGISYISAVLKLKGHETRLFVLTQGNQRQVQVWLEEFAPKAICFTAVATTYHLIRNLAGIYKGKHLETYLLAGGCHVSLNPEEVISDSFDAICIGEGEYPTLELAEQLEKGLNPSQIKNLWIRSGRDIEKNPTRPFIDNLDELPFPDRKMWKEWIQYPNKTPAILLGRGCPFNCTYCCNHRLARLSSGKYCRFRSAENVLSEIKEYLAEYQQTEEIYFEVETIGVNLEYALQLCVKLERFNREREKPLSFGVNLRVTPGIDYESLFEALHLANFKFVEIGLESGSERVRREILKRNYSNEDIIKATAFARKYGLGFTTYNMVGLPGETLSDFRQTVELNRKIQPDIAGLSVFFPYPGTDLAEMSKKEGLIDKKIDTQSIIERVQPVLNLPDFPKKQVTRSYIWFEYDVFKGYRPVLKLLFLVLKAKVMTSPLLLKLFNSLLNIPVLENLKKRLVG